MNITKHNEIEYKCDEEEYLLSITKFGNLEDPEFWLRIKSSSSENITNGFISLKGLISLRDDITKIIDKLK